MTALLALAAAVPLCLAVLVVLAAGSRPDRIAAAAGTPLALVMTGGFVTVEPIKAGAHE